MAKGRVLELGCGAGLTGIITASIQRALSRHGERGLSICMTDVDESVISTCKRNMNLPVSKWVTHSLHQ
jgi:protein-lysine N-methyltransferase EEF2KMT